MSHPEENPDCAVTITLQLGTVQQQFQIPSRMRLAQFTEIALALDSGVIEDALRRDEATACQISCRAGCGACCRQRVPISIAEACVISELIMDQPKDRSRILQKRITTARRKLESHPQALNPAGEVEYFSLGLPCPFLEEESCSIHPSRPAACRQHLVTTPSARCASLNGGADCVTIHVRMEEMLATAVSSLIGGPPLFIALTSVLEWSAMNGPLIMKTWDVRELFGALEAAFRRSGGLPFAWSLEADSKEDSILQQQPIDPDPELRG